MSERILVVEDNERNRRLLKDLLEFGGYAVTGAETAERGLELARQSPPSLILMDISLPGMDGLEATRTLKSDDRTRTIPVVALTAHATAHDEALARAAGCDEFVTKPIDAIGFAEYIGRLIAAGANTPLRPES